MKYFLKVHEGLDVMPLLIQIQRQPDLWNRHTQRKDFTGSSHTQMSDIWVRYNPECADLAKANDEHDSAWYPAFYQLPTVRPIVFFLMARVEGERLGGVLITKIPPGCVIDPHIDRSWHADYYDKFYVSLQSEPGANFYCEDEVINPRRGDVYWFDNSHRHWVTNESKEDRMTLIVCIRTHRFRDQKPAA